MPDDETPERQDTVVMIGTVATSSGAQGDAAPTKDEVAIEFFEGIERMVADRPNPYMR